MSILFALYFSCFVMLIRRKRGTAGILLAVSTAGSIGIFLYHVDSSLKLNF